MIAIIGTEQGSNRGGIATAISSFCSLLEENYVEFRCVVTHKPNNGKFLNFILFLCSFFSILALRLLCIMRREKFVVYLHLGPKGSLIRKLILAIYSRLLFSKVISHHHSPAFKDYLTERTWLSSLLFAICRVSHENLVLTQWWQEQYAESAIHNTKVVPNCIETNNQISAPPRKSNILSIARLVEEKNVQLVIKAMQHLPESYNLVIAGDGPYRNELEALVNDLELRNRVSFSGWIDSKQRATALLNSDVFVLPSQYDSFGMVFVEALSFGRPAVFGDHPAVKSSVGDLYGAVECSSFDPKNVANNILATYDVNYSPVEIQASLMKKYSKTVVSDALIAVLRG